MHLVKTSTGKVLYIGDDSTAAMSAFFHEKEGAQYLNLEKEQLVEELARIGYKVGKEEKKEEELPYPFSTSDRQQAYEQVKAAGATMRSALSEANKVVNDALAEVNKQFNALFNKK